MSENVKCLVFQFSGILLYVVQGRILESREGAGEAIIVFFLVFFFNEIQKQPFLQRCRPIATSTYGYYRK